MENIFDIINKGLPKPKETAPADSVYTVSSKQPAVKDIPIRDLVLRWQKNQTPEDTSELLARMKPTITSAMNSFAPGMDDHLAVKAANITLNALKLYDPRAGAEPATFVFNNLKRLSRYSAKASNIIPQPEGVALERKRVQDIMAKFEDEHDREPSMAELADLTGISVKRLDRVLQSQQVLPESATLTQDSQQDRFGKSDVTDDDYFEYVYSSVGPIDQKIMEWSSGKHGVKPLTNNQIAAKLKMSAAAVSQRKNRIQGLMSDVRSLL